jgi:hypothetical protein
MAQDLLIQPSELGQYGASSDFLAQFALRPLELQIGIGGALGAMAVQWRRQGETNFSELFYSDAVSSWSLELPDPSWTTITCAAGSYVAGTLYVISSNGVVIPGVGAIAGIAATRSDQRLLWCTAATSKGVTWMQPRVVPPVISVGAQVKEWLADLAIYGLRKRLGLTPAGAGPGDDEVRARNEAAERNLKLIGSSSDRPPDLVDSSTGNAGAGFNAYPTGDDLRGF